MAWENPSTDSTSEPALRAISAQLLVGFCAVRLPFRSANDLIESSSLRVTITPCEIEYGSERSYFCLRSSLIVTSFATISKRSASSAANIASHGVSTNSTSTPSFSPTAFATSTS